MHSRLNKALYHGLNPVAFIDFDLPCPKEWSRMNGHSAPMKKKVSVRDLGEVEFKFYVAINDELKLITWEMYECFLPEIHYANGIARIEHMRKAITMFRLRARLVEESIQEMESYGREKTSNI